MTFGERLTQLRKDNGFSKRKAFAEKLNIPETTLRNYETNAREPGHTFLVQISKLFNVSIDWLLGNSQEKELKNYYQLKTSEYKHIEKYRSLDDFGRESVDLMMDRECKRVNEKRELEKELTIQAFEEHKIEILHRLLPYQGKIASAGTSVSFADIMAGVIEAEENDINRHADYTIGVNGDSMEPEFYDGDIVYVQKATELNIGEIGIFQKDNNIYIKKVGANQLISLNDKYKPLSGEDVLCLGKVIGKVEGAYTIRN